jgi:hypothetical protein
VRGVEGVWHDEDGRVVACWMNLASLRMLDVGKEKESLGGPVRQ